MPFASTQLTTQFYLHASTTIDGYSVVDGALSTINFLFEFVHCSIRLAFTLEATKWVEKRMNKKKHFGDINIHNEFGTLDSNWQKKNCRMFKRKIECIRSAGHASKLPMHFRTLEITNSRPSISTSKLTRKHYYYFPPPWAAHKSEMDQNSWRMQSPSFLRYICSRFVFGVWMHGMHSQISGAIKCLALSNWHRFGFVAPLQIAMHSSVSRRKW